MLGQDQVQSGTSHHSGCSRIQISWEADVILPAPGHIRPQSNHERATASLHREDRDRGSGIRNEGSGLQAK